MSIEYASFLIRLWREAGTDATTRLTDWCSEVEHIQSGQRWTFSALDELLDFLRREVEEPEVLNRCRFGRSQSAFASLHTDSSPHD